MKKYTINTATLFDTLTGFDNEEEYVPLEYGGYIQKETNGNKEWFDLKTDDGTLCMDGENCELLEETKEYVILQEENKKIPFKLSKKEFGIAAILCTSYHINGKKVTKMEAHRFVETECEKQWDENKSEEHGEWYQQDDDTKAKYYNKLWTDKVKSIGEESIYDTKQNTPSIEATAPHRRVVHQQLCSIEWMPKCDLSVPYGAMTVQIHFSSKEAAEDEVEFCIPSWNTEELAELFTTFCKENHSTEVTITDVYIMRVANTVDKLTEMEEKL